MAATSYGRISVGTIPEVMFAKESLVLCLGISGVPSAAFLTFMSS